MQDCRLYINGQWVDTKSGFVGNNINPATGIPVGTVQFSGPEEVEAAISSAYAAAPGWAAITAMDRQKYCFVLPTTWNRTWIGLPVG